MGANQPSLDNPCGLITAAGSEEGKFSREASSGCSFSLTRLYLTSSRGMNVVLFFPNDRSHCKAREKAYQELLSIISEFPSSAPAKDLSQRKKAGKNAGGSTNSPASLLTDWLSPRTRRVV